MDRMREDARRQDSQQLARQWAILQLLSQAKTAYSVKELAEQLQRSKATIERDLATLSHVFALVEEQVGKQKKVYRIAPGLHAMETIQFTVMELLAIFAAQSAAGPLTGTPLHDDLRSAVQKVRGHLAPRHNGGLDAMSRVFTPHVRAHVDYAAHGETIDSLADAIARRIVCEIEYHAAWKGTTRTHRARPVKLVAHRSALYLFACLGDHERVTTLAVHRIRSLTKTSETFTAPRVDVEAHAKNAFGIFVSDAEEDVEVRFDAEIAWRIEEVVFHPEERKERLPDGTLRYQIRTSAQWEVVPWVQSFGPLAELVAPASWRECIATNAAAVVERYGAITPTRSASGS